MFDPRHLIRRTLVTSWGVPENKLVDDFRWIDELGHEDSGWFLREVANEIPGVPLFKSRISESDLAAISTVAQLADHIKSVILATKKG